MKSGQPWTLNAISRKKRPDTIGLSTRLWGINPTNSVFIPQSLILRAEFKYIEIGSLTPSLIVS